MVRGIPAVAGRSGGARRGGRARGSWCGATRRHQEWRRAVEIAGDADQRGQEAGALRLSVPARQFGRAASAAWRRRPARHGLRSGQQERSPWRPLGFGRTPQTRSRSLERVKGRRSAITEAAAFASLANPSNLYGKLAQFARAPHLGSAGRAIALVGTHSGDQWFFLQASEPKQRRDHIKAGASCPTSRWSTTTATSLPRFLSLEAEGYRVQHLYRRRERARRPEVQSA